MTHPFKAVGLSYKTAPLAIRELIALDEPACRRFLDTLHQQLGLSDLLVLSTCNRTEIYYAAERDQSPAIIEALGQLRRHIDHQGDAVLEQSIAEGELGAHVKRARHHYQQRRDVFCTLLRQQESPWLSFDAPAVAWPPGCALATRLAYIMTLPRVAGCWAWALGMAGFFKRRPKPAPTTCAWALPR